MSQRSVRINTVTVLGLDSCKGGWVAVAIDETGYVDAFVASSIGVAERTGRERWAVATIVVDIPIGLPDSGPRLADVEARAFIRPRSSSVFSTPVRPVLAASSYDEARAASIQATGGTSLSKQAWAICDRIRDVDDHVRSGESHVRILEGHPEVSFRAMAGVPLLDYKKSIEGALHRRELLHGEGIELPRGIERDVKSAALDDIHDAAAMAWTARRAERGEERSMPDPPERFSDGFLSAIWY
ncbi:DUF429 domain-containing protein [Demequina sp. SO4-18]|uniref:DUF429 domain-containing protein n=1 Tax=Demequina sp. SO4-18 TaxID=3401026 RepID=UPI003B5940FD